MKYRQTKPDIPYGLHTNLNDNIFILIHPHGDFYRTTPSIWRMCTARTLITSKDLSVIKYGILSFETADEIIHNIHNNSI